MKIIINNEISIDGSLTGFTHKPEIFYSIVGKFNADGVLVGSNTAITGIKMFMTEIPKETKHDFNQRKGNYWYIRDTKAQLLNLLHVFRQSEYCDDIVLFIKDDPAYIKYLKERNYRYHIETDIKNILNIIKNEYKVKILRTDCGKTLNSVLLNNNLVDEISLVVSPNIVGKDNFNIFESANKKKLELISSETIQDSVWLRYKVK